MINAKMQQWMTHWLVRYAAALAAVGAGWMLRAGLTSVVGPGLPTYVTFYPAVMLVALLAGFGPGIVATAAVALMTDYWLLPPIGFGIQGLAESVGLALFCGMGVFMSAVAALYHRARRQALAQDTEVWRTEKQISSGEPAGQALLLNAGLIVSLTILLAAGWQCLQYLGAATEADRQTTATYTLLEQVEQLLGALTDAETDERGFLLTGDEKYLGSYQAALGTVDASLAAMHRLAAGDPGQQQRLAVIEPLIRDRVAELKEAIALRRTRGLEAAVQFVKTGKGKSLMDEVRQRLGEAQEREEDFLQLVTTTRAADNRKTLQALLTGGIFGILVLVTVFLFLKRENAGRRRAEAELRLHRDRLQEAVTARTAELSQANASIQQQREWLHVTLSSIGDAVLVTDTAGRITFLNPVAERLLGCLEEEALGQPVQEVFRTVDEETRVPAEDIFARVLREGCAISLANHTALVTRDGKEIPIEDSAAPIRHSTGTVSGVVVVFHDVTEKRRAQAAVLESERQFRTLADSIPNLAWWANVDGYITWYNRRWFEYTGTTPQQMEGWGWQSVHDPVLLPAVLEKWRTSLATGQAFEMTFPLRGADGVFRPFLTRGIPLKDAQGHVQQWFGTNTDVSEQRRAEEAHARLAAIVESSQDAILAKNLDGTITSWNQGAERLFGYTAEEAIGRSVRMLLPPERQDEEDRIMARLQAGERVQHLETVRLTKDGRSLAVSVTSSPLQDGAGRVIGASKILRDITERKQTEEAVEQLNAELRQRVADLQAANEDVQASRRAALSLAEDALEARSEAERTNAELQKANEILGASRRAALNLMDDAVQARGRAEQAGAELVKLNRILQARSKSDQALMRAQNEVEFIEAVCRIVVEDCGHAMVWVGFAEDDEGQTVRPAAQAGFEAGYLETLNLTWADNERGRGPTGTAIRTGQPSMCRNMLTDPRFAPWRAEAVKRGYASSLVLPLLADGRAFGALSIYSRQPDGFLDDEARLLTELAGDLAYGITALRLSAAKARAEEAQRQSEERYRGLVELSPEALFVNRDDRIVLVNPAALRLFGASSSDQLLGKSPFEVFHPDCHAMMRKRTGQVLAGQRVPVVEEKVIRLDGVVVDVEVVAAPVVDQGQRAIQVLLRDITERKRAEAALQQSTDDLKRSNRDLEQFAYVASHDLQEPLRAVGGYVKLLAHRFPDRLDDKARGYIEGAFEGATRMEQLIGDLLAYSRIGTRGGNFAHSALGPVLDQTLRNLHASIESAQATVTHDALPTLKVDATQMMQLFQNLIGNALKFQGESPARIHIGAQKQEGRWVFSVRDNGIGIEPQYYDKIFQIFKRLHTRKEYAGTGIGLAVCKKIVERHGGTIWVESQPGEGSTFYFSIPEAAEG